MDDDADLRELLSVLWRRRSVILAVTLVAAAAAALLNFLVLDPIYEASAILMVSPPRFHVVGGADAADLVVRGAALTAESLVPMVHNEVVAARVAKRLPSATVPRPDLMVGQVKVIPIRGTNLLRLSARDASPEGAAALAAAWGEAITGYTDSFSAAETRRALSIIVAKTEATRAELLDAEKSLRDFQTRSRIPVLEERVAETVRRIALYESRLAEIEQGGAALGGEVTLQPRDGAYALTVLSAKSPSQVRQVLEALQTDLASHQAALAAEKQREAQVLRRVNLARSTHRLLAVKREELRILLGADKGIVEVAVPPVVPRVPVAPSKIMNIALAVLLGLIVGTGVAFAVEFYKPLPKAVPRVVGSGTPNPIHREN